MDELDRQILERMADDARKPLSHVAAALGVAQTTLHQRVRRLEERGVIRGARLVIDWEQAGLPVVAVVSVSIDEAGPLQDAAERFARIPWVQNCFSITGEFDLMLVVRARSSDHLGEVLEMIKAAVHGRSRTVIVLSTYFDGRIPPLPLDTQ
jgi:Lrp/AsnC family leucine-responsive transcriptional regulator